MVVKVLMALQKNALSQTKVQHRNVIEVKVCNQKSVLTLLNVKAKQKKVITAVAVVVAEG